MIAFDATNHLVWWNVTKLNTSITIIGYSVDALRVGLAVHQWLLCRWMLLQQRLRKRLHD